MYSQRRPAFALLFYIFQLYLKGILEMRLINTALVFSFPSSDWQRVCKTMWNYGLLRNISYDSAWEYLLMKTAFKWAVLGKPFCRGLPAPLSTLTVSTVSLLKLPSGRLLWASLSCMHTRGGCRRSDWLSWWQQEGKKPPVLLRGAGSTAHKQTAHTWQVVWGDHCSVWQWQRQTTGNFFIFFPYL